MYYILDFIIVIIFKIAWSMGGIFCMTFILAFSHLAGRARLTDLVSSEERGSRLE